MKRKWCIVLFAAFLILTMASSGLGVVEWNVQKTLRLEKSPLDMAVSARGAWVYVLTDDGAILIYNSQGVLKDQIEVGTHIDGIDAGPREDILIIKSKKKKTVQHIQIDFIHDINIAGSPFQGPGDAPVAIAVFNDFQ